MNAALRYDAATVGYVDPVVTGASLEVCPGEIVGLVGPNGAGKTTLVRAVVGGARIFGGEVLVEGRPRSSYRPLELARLVAVLPQTLPATFAFSARQFVEMGRHAHVTRFGGIGDEDRRIVEEVMTLTDTGRLADVPVDTLSGGDLQRLTLAQALAQRPAVLLLDEPTSHLDLDHRLQVLDVVRSLADEGMAVLAVFHDLDMAARYADRLAIVHEGSLADAREPERVLTAESLDRFFGVRAVIGTDPVTGAVQVLPVMRKQGGAPPRGVRVLVVSGSGSGGAVMRRLALAGFAVEAGALARGDTDHDVAASLDIPMIELAPYGSMSVAGESAVEQAARDVDAVVVCATPFGPANVGNLRAVARGTRPIVLVGESRPEDDFTDGEAAAMWARLRDGGALRCDGARGVTRCVEEATGR